MRGLFHIADITGRWPRPSGLGQARVRIDLGWTECRRLVVRLKSFFVFVMHSFLGAGDSG